MAYLVRPALAAGFIVFCLSASLPGSTGPLQAQAPGAGQQRAAATPEALRAREQQRVSLLVSGDIERLAAMLSPTLTYSHSNGTVDSKEALLASFRSGQVKWRSLNHREVAVRFVGADVALLNGISDAVVAIGGQDQQIPLRFTMVYVRRDGEWLLEAWHSTRRQQ